MDVVESVQNDYIGLIKSEVRSLPEYKAYVSAIDSKDANKIALATTALTAAAQAKILQQIKEDTLNEGDKTWMASTLHYDGYTNDLRRHYTSTSLGKVLRDDNWKLQLSTESTIATCITESANSWQVWISTLLAIARIDNKEEYNGTFLYLEDRAKIAESIVNTTFTSPKSWTISCLAKITRDLESKPVHFIIRIPTSMERNAAVLHESIILRELREASQFNTLLPYCYGVYSCPGSPSYTEEKVVSTCVPKAGVIEAYSLEQKVEGMTLADALPLLTQKDFDALIVVIASTLDFLYNTYGFVHSNLTASNIILEELKKENIVRYMDRYNTYREVLLPFRPRMVGYSYSQTSTIPWISRYSLPGQSPVADVRMLYKSITAIKGHKLNFSNLNEILAMINNAIPAAVSSIPLWTTKSKTLSFFNIYDYILEQYEGYPGIVVEHRTDTPLHLTVYSEEVPLETLEGELQQLTGLLTTIDKRREAYSHIAELPVLRDWIALRVAEDRLLLTGTPIMFYKLPIYTDPTGEPLLYDSDDRLIIPEGYSEYDEEGRPIVYLNGEPIAYTDHIPPKITTSMESTTESEEEETSEEEAEETSEESPEEEEVIILKKPTEYTGSGEESEEEFEVTDEESESE